MKGAAEVLGSEQGTQMWVADWCDSRSTVMISLKVPCDHYNLTTDNVQTHREDRWAPDWPVENSASVHSLVIVSGEGARPRKGYWPHRPHVRLARNHEAIFVRGHRITETQVRGIVTEEPLFGEKTAGSVVASFSKRISGGRNSAAVSAEP